MKTFIIQQKIKPLVNQYVVYEAAANATTAPGEATEKAQPGALMAFAEQKRFAFKEKFTMFSDDSKSQKVFEVEARQVMDFGARYDVRDPDGAVLGTLGKNFKASLLNSTWHIFSPGQEDKPLLVIRERSQALAIFRRIWGLLPYIGDIPFFLKYNFDFTDPTTNQVVATYDKTTTFRDHYQLTIQDTAELMVDWRVLVSLGVMMDAMQSR